MILLAFNWATAARDSEEDWWGMLAGLEFLLVMVIDDDDDIK